jgi:uncharacterized membrane protein
MRFIKSLAALAIGLCVLILFYDWTFNDRIRIVGFQGDEPTQSPRPIAMDVAFCATALVLGILFGTIYEQISKRQRINWKTELVRALGSAHFATSLVIAPVLFAGVYSAARSQPDLIVALMFAFQNGFFCDRVAQVPNLRNSNTTVR